MRHGHWLWIVFLCLAGSLFLETGCGGSASSSTNGTVNQTKQIKLGINLPNHEFYSDFGALIDVTMSCSGCQVGDTLNGQFLNFGGATENQTLKDPAALASWQEAFNLAGYKFAPGLIKQWIEGPNAAESNTLQLAFDGGKDIAAEDPSSGEIYYDYTGDSAPGSYAVLKFKPDSTADGKFATGGYGVAVDNKTHDFLISQAAGVSAFSPDGIGLNAVIIGNPGPYPPATYSLAVDSRDGLACATQPDIPTTYCFYPTTTPQVVQPFPLPNLPVASQPTAIKVLDATHVVLYTRADQTLRWFTVAGTAATVEGKLILQKLTAADGNYWTQYPGTGGWDLVQVGSTLGVMGQVVNSDGTVRQKLALVDNTTQSLTQYVDLPAGTVHIAPDPANNAIVAEYPDFSGPSPVTRFERVYVDTANSAALASTSTLVPGAGFLVTNDGSKIAVFVEGKADFEPNQ